VHLTSKKKFNKNAMFLLEKRGICWSLAFLFQSALDDFPILPLALRPSIPYFAFPLNIVNNQAIAYWSEQYIDFIKI